MAISLFSGIGGFDLGFQKAGIETVLQVEQDKHCLTVLARHWPEVERLNDVRDVGCGLPERVLGPGAVRSDASGLAGDSLDGVRGTDLIFGGFPCQDVSVAGQRAGLSGERSGLWFEFARILGDLRPRWCVIENVPGLLSSNSGRDFAVILDGLDQLGYGVAWRILDAQHFGVPQRRRRVFIVGCLGDVTAAAAVLAVREGGSGDSQESGAPGEDVAGTLGGRSARSHTELDGHGAYITSGATNQSGAVTAAWGNSQLGNAQADASPLLVSFDALNHSTNETAATLADDKHRKDYVYVPELVGALSDGAHHRGGLNGQDAYTGRIIAPAAGVRRLTPLECERLQGFPDFWTEGQSDSHRYRQLGNAVAVPCAEYIGHRIMRVAALLEGDGPDA